MRHPISLCALLMLAACTATSNDDTSDTSAVTAEAALASGVSSNALSADDASVYWLDGDGRADSADPRNQSPAPYVLMQVSRTGGERRKISTDAWSFAMGETSLYVREDAAVVAYDKQTHVRRVLAPIPGDPAFSTLRATHDALYLLSHGGAITKISLDGRTTDLGTFPNTVFELAVDASAVYFVTEKVTHGQIAATITRVAFAGGAPTVVASEHSEIRSLTAEGTGVVWSTTNGSSQLAGTVPGLVRAYSGGSVTTLASFDDAQATALAIDGSQVFIATEPMRAPPGSSHIFETTLAGGALSSLLTTPGIDDIGLAPHAGRLFYTSGGKLYRR